jgi:hypothetical protein
MGFNDAERISAEGGFRSSGAFFWFFAAGERRVFALAVQELSGYSSINVLKTLFAETVSLL